MSDYGKFHKHRTNLAIHITMVPLFDFAAIGFVVMLLAGEFLAAGLSLVAMLLSLRLQKTGHALEEHPPEPFGGPADFASRILSEQFYRFWRFVFTGAWGAHWRRAARETG